MPIINKTRAAIETCSNCKRDHLRVIGWSLAENTGGGWQGMGQVRLCVDCLRTEADALAAIEPFIEEIRLDLTERGIPFAAKASREALLRLAAGGPAEPGDTGATTPAAAPGAAPGSPSGGNQFGQRNTTVTIPSEAELKRKPRAWIVGALSGAPYFVVGIPDSANKNDLIARLIAEATKAAYAPA